MVSERGYNNVQSSTRFDLKNKIWPNVSSWEEAMIRDFSITYQATWPQWDPYRRWYVYIDGYRTIDSLWSGNRRRNNLNVSHACIIVKYLYMFLFRLVSHIIDYGHIKAVKYTIGEDTDCKEISANTNSQLYCNGPLKPDTWYHVRMRAFTYGGYTDSDVFKIKTSEYIFVYLQYSLHHVL